MKISLQQSPEGTKITFNGALDEHAEAPLKDLRKAMTGKTLLFDCERVTFINSFGVRVWFQFIESFSPDTTSTFFNCPEAMIEYTIILNRFFGRGRVHNFYAAHECTQCRTQGNLSIQVDQLGNPPAWNPPPCAKCKGALRSDQELQDFLDAVAGRRP